MAMMTNREIISLSDRDAYCSIYKRERKRCDIFYLRLNTQSKAKGEIKQDWQNDICLRQMMSTRVCFFTLWILQIFGIFQIKRTMFIILRHILLLPPQITYFHCELKRTCHLICLMPSELYFSNTPLDQKSRKYTSKSDSNLHPPSTTPDGITKHNLLNLSHLKFFICNVGIIISSPGCGN